MKTNSLFFFRIASNICSCVRLKAYFLPSLLACSNVIILCKEKCVFVCVMCGRSLQCERSVTHAL